MKKLLTLALLLFSLSGPTGAQEEHGVGGGRGQGGPAASQAKELAGGKAVLRAQPEYPVAAKERRAGGAVVLRFNADETGRVIEAKPLACSSALFAEAGTKAALKSVFEPLVVNGRPFKTAGVIYYHWVLR